MLLMGNLPIWTFNITNRSYIYDCGQYWFLYNSVEYLIELDLDIIIEEHVFFSLS